jgi:hypothetical protein
MTAESMVNALKTKGYLERNETKPELAIPEPSKDYRGLSDALRDFDGSLHIHLSKATALQGLNAILEKELI